MEARKETRDLIIVGGGISGIGVAREAAKQGLNTLVLEARKCCSQTSNNSLRIIHGGFRYLQSFDIPRMMASIRDQTTLLAEFPEYIKPLPCLMPLRRTGLKSRLPVMAASTLYHAALRIGGSKLPPPFVLSGEVVERRSPVLFNQVDYGALLWHDALMIDPLSVAQALQRNAEELGVTIQEGCAVKNIAKNDSIYTVQDINGSTYTAKSVVTTLGPWISTIERPVTAKPLSLQWCKAFNIEISRQLDPTYAIGIEGRDGRLFFAVPRGTGTAIGTWYLPIEAPSFDLQVTKEELTTFITAFNEALPEPELQLDHVVSVDVGVLPMKSVSSHGPVLYGREEVYGEDGYFEVLSTKYTTFRSQGAAVVDRIKGNR